MRPLPSDSPFFVARLEQAEQVIAQVRKLHEPTLAVVQWWDDQTGEGEALVCPSCHHDEDEINRWALRPGTYDVKPEYWVDSYVLSPCPTLAAIEMGGW